MTPGLRTHRSATLHIATPTGIPEDMRDGIREIVSLVSEDRGKGHARALMYQVTAEADRTGMVLLLTAEPTGGTQAQLERFYQRFGFARIQDSPRLMARQPERPLLAAFAAHRPVGFRSREGFPVRLGASAQEQQDQDVAHGGLLKGRSVARNG